MIGTEEKIIEDLRKIERALAPEKIAKSLISTIGEKLVKRIETMDTQRISEVSDKVITDAVETDRSHPSVMAILGLGASWFMADKMFKRQKTANGKIIEQLQQEIAELTKKTGQFAGETGEVIARKSQSVLEEVSGYVDENPLMVGFIGLSAGLILGILTSGVLNKKGFLEETSQAVQSKTRQEVQLGT